jgi:hypothetical protein
MMVHREDEIQKLERALTQAYRAQTDIPLGGVNVTQDVMRDIRRSPGESGRWVSAGVLDQLVWRAATIAAAVVLAVTVLTVGVLRTTAGESAGLLAEEFESAPLFGDY